MNETVDHSIRGTGWIDWHNMVAQNLVHNNFLVVSTISEQNGLGCSILINILSVS